MAEEAPLGLGSLLSGFQPIAPVVNDNPETKPDDKPEDKPEDQQQAPPDKSEDKTDDNPDSKTDDDQEEDLITRLKHEIDPELEGDFEVSFEGISQFTQAVAEKNRKAGKEELFDELQQIAPELDGYIQYRMAGGDPAKYFEVLSKSNDLPADLSSVEAQKQVVSKYLSSKGFDEDDIKDQLTALEDTDKLEAAAKKYADKLQVASSSSAEELIKEQQAAALKTKQANDAYWDSIKTTITTGKVGANGTTVIPATERDSFYNWLAKPVKDGKPQQALDWNEMSNEQKLAVQYFIYKKGDLKSVASRIVTTGKVDKTIEAIAKNSGDRMNGGKDQSKKTNVIPIKSGGLASLFQ